MESSLYHKQEGSADTETETHAHCCGCCTALVGDQQRRRTERRLGERPGCPAGSTVSARPDLEKIVMNLVGEERAEEKGGRKRKRMKGVKEEKEERKEKE